MMSGHPRPLWRFLGEPRLTWRGQDLPKRIGKKAVGMLAYVALCPDGASRDEIAALLWPGIDLARSKHNLRQCLVTLRKVFGEDFGAVFELTERRLTLNRDAVDVDVNRLIEIETLGAAPPEELIDLCRGPFLRALITRSRPFDEWADGQRDRFVSLTSRAMGRAMAAAEQAGQAAAASRIAAALTELGVDAGALQTPPISRAGTPALQPGGRRFGRWGARALAGLGTMVLLLAGLWAAFLVSPTVRDAIERYLPVSY